MINEKIDLWDMPRGTHAIYALTDDPDYLVWDMDLVENTEAARLCGTATIRDYTPVAIIPVTLRLSEGGRAYKASQNASNQDVLLAFLEAQNASGL